MSCATVGLNRPPLPPGELRAAGRFANQARNGSGGGTIGSSSRPPSWAPAPVAEQKGIWSLDPRLTRLYPTANCAGLLPSNAASTAVARRSTLYGSGELATAGAGTIAAASRAPATVAADRRA